MMERKFELLAQSDGSAKNISTLLVTAVVIVAAVAGVAYARRIQDRRLREESGHAEQVSRLISAPDNGDIRLGARRTDRTTDVELVAADGAAALARNARQEAEIYLEHHRIALRNHSDYQRASLWSGLLGFSVVLVGAALTYFVRLDVGVVTAVAGAIPAAAGRLLFRQAEIVGGHAAENLRGLEDSVRKYSAQQAALATTAEIRDRQARDRMYEVIALRMVFPADDLETLLRRRARSSGLGETEEES